MTIRYRLRNELYGAKRVNYEMNVVKFEKSASWKTRPGRKHGRLGKPKDRPVRLCPRKGAVRNERPNKRAMNCGVLYVPNAAPLLSNASERMKYGDKSVSSSGNVGPSYLSSRPGLPSWSSSITARDNAWVCRCSWLGLG